MTSTNRPVCLGCVHLRRGEQRILRKGMTCDAFPGGIPDVVLDGVSDHTEPVDGDHGIRFLADPAGERPL